MSEFLEINFLFSGILLETTVTGGMSFIDIINKISLPIIALVNVILAYVVLRYNKKKETRDAARSIAIMEQNMRIQWFRELVYNSTNKKIIEDFYTNLLSLREKISSNELTEDDKQELMTFVKSEAKKMRISFIDAISFIDRELHQKIKENNDALVDHLVEILSNDGLKLKYEPTYESQIHSPIIYSRNQLMGIIYRFKGQTDSYS